MESQQSDETKLIEVTSNGNDFIRPMISIVGDYKR